MVKGRITPEFIQKIKESVNLIDVVGEHVVLRKSGSNHSGLCPFHSERSPSFSVSEQKQVYHCYGCKRGGDLLRFVMELHGISFMEAVEELADRGRIPLPKDYAGAGENEDPEVAKRRAAAREKLATAYKLNRFVAAFYHGNLNQLPLVNQYFLKRGVNADLIRNFYLGAAPASWDALSHHLVAKKAPIELAVELGLIKQSQKTGRGGAAIGPGYFDIFRNRAMFPILDLRGKVVGFGGRALPGDDSDGPKYMNSSESFLFHKSKLAYGMFQAQKHIREKDEVILVEGYFDVLALHAAGFENVVATCGTSLTPDHLALFKRFASRITILFDGDRAGVSATERAMEIGLDEGLVLYGAAMPEGLDPDEVLFDQETGMPTSEGREKMRSILEASRPLLDARIDEQVEASAKGPEAQTQALKRIGAWLGRFRDPVGREVRVQALQKRLGLSGELLQQVMGASSAGQARKGPVGVHAGPQKGLLTSSGRPGPEPSSQVRTAPQSAAGAPPAGARPPQGRRTRFEKLGEGDRLLLRAIARGDAYARQIVEAGANLPPEMTISDLFDYFPARNFMARLLQTAGAVQHFKSVSGAFLEPDLDNQVQATLTEALVSDDVPLAIEEVRLAIGRAIGRSWARFSQQIKAALKDAEAKKDAGLHEKLLKEYLDVRRKMKEFNSFYDEA